MGDLTNLSNVELRSICLEYGLPNVPVTNTSRNVLIRKLLATMNENTTTPPQQKNRKKTSTPRSRDCEYSPTNIPVITTRENNSSVRKTLADMNALILEKENYEKLRINHDNSIDNNMSHTRTPSPLNTSYLSKSGTLTTSYNLERSPTAMDVDEEYEKDEIELPVGYDISPSYAFTTPSPLFNDAYNSGNEILNAVKADTHFVQPPLNSLYPTLPNEYDKWPAVSGLNTGSNTSHILKSPKVYGKNRVSVTHCVDNFDSSDYSEGNMSSDDAEEPIDFVRHETNLAGVRNRGPIPPATNYLPKQKSRDYIAKTHYQRGPLHDEEIKVPWREFFNNFEDNYRLKAAVGLLLAFILAVFLYALLMKH